MEDPSSYTGSSDEDYTVASGREVGGQRRVWVKLLGASAAAALVASCGVFYATYRAGAAPATTPAPTAQSLGASTGGLAPLHTPADAGATTLAPTAQSLGVSTGGPAPLPTPAAAGVSTVDEPGVGVGTPPPIMERVDADDAGTVVAIVPGIADPAAEPGAGPEAERGGTPAQAGGAVAGGPEAERGGTPAQAGGWVAGGQLAGGCFMNQTYYTEPSGKHAMPLGHRSEEVSPAACQLRCQNTPGCEHFSFWSDGGCLLTSFTAYHGRYRSQDSLNVIAGPRDCASVMPETIGPTLDLQSSLGLPAFVAQEAAGCGSRHSDYDLTWKAAGRTFFDDFQFTTLSETHGAEWYLNKTEAFRLGVVATSDTNALLRVGDQVQVFKRRSVMLRSALAWRPDQGFIVAMKYKHVPYGAGIWPAFWLMNSDYLWPEGGELDILEYANDAQSKVTFHSDKNCSLDASKLHDCMKGPTVDQDVVHSCLTNYTGNQLGCKPPQIRRTGKWFADHPGVIATVWDPSGIFVFHIPDAEVPPDLAGDKPNPNTWERWMIAYLPFDPNSCHDIARPQEIVLNIALCGDWAGGAWRTSDEARKTGFLEPYCFAGNVREPATDCCTIFMSSPKAEEYLKTRAYFDIEYIKVFQPAGTPPSNISSGTYRNDGIPLVEPCIPCNEPRWIAKGSHSLANVCCPGCDLNATKYWWNDVCNCGGTLVCGPPLP